MKMPADAQTKNRIFNLFGHSCRIRDDSRWMELQIHESSPLVSRFSAISAGALRRATIALPVSVSRAAGSRGENMAGARSRRAPRRLQQTAASTAVTSHRFPSNRQLEDHLRPLSCRLQHLLMAYTMAVTEDAASVLDQFIHDGWCLV
jgi:hypothetical protein